MTVRSEPLVDGKIKGKESAVISRASLARGRNAFERIVGIALLVGSILGNVMAFNGGSIWPLAVVAIVAGLGIQTGLTLLQWFYCPHVPRDVPWHARLFIWLRGLRWPYAASVVVGAGLSVAGYRVVLLPIFNAILLGIQWSLTEVSFAAWALLIVVSLIVEVIPENILVE